MLHSVADCGARLCVWDVGTQRVRGYGCSSSAPASHIVPRGRGRSRQSAASLKFYSVGTVSSAWSHP